MGSYNFRSVGVTSEERAADAIRRSVTPIGIKTPLEFGDGLFRMRMDLASSVTDNLRNLLLTNHGERLGLYDFGANLRPLVADWVSLDDFDSVAFDNISSAIGKWMPYVSPQSYESHMVSPHTNTAGVQLRLTYDIPALKVTGKTIEITLRVM